MVVPTASAANLIKITVIGLVSVFNITISSIFFNHRMLIKPMHQIDVGALQTHIKNNTQDVELLSS